MLGVAVPCWGAPPLRRVTGAEPRAGAENTGLKAEAGGSSAERGQGPPTPAGWASAEPVALKKERGSPWGGGSGQQRALLGQSPKAFERRRGGAAPSPEPMTRGSAPALYLPIELHKMGSFRRPRPRFMSSPVLSDLPRFQAARQAVHLSSNSAWNSVQTAVINVFKGGSLQNNELFLLNENIRRLLKSELGSFITDYFQGQELTIRQIALLGFRDLVLLRVKLEEMLPAGQAKVPSSIVQMLLILQSVHEPTGPSEGYLQLEELVKRVVSPFLGTSSGDRVFSSAACALARRHSRARPKVTGLNYSQTAVTPRPLHEMALTPLTEQEGEAYLEKCGSIRRHTVANAHSDIQLLAMATMMHSGMGEESDGSEKCLLLPPSFPPHRQCSSEPNIVDSPEEIEEGVADVQEHGELSCTSLS
uniref:Proline-rich protein 5-like isoform X3 n=1 Tax=Phascolarctos cinereus TaxID=38626 RepID=A0A6P5IBC3_PHACI|nr:proline-rich protein 5-like isoform X3 [Phascolarctos cinereus]